MEHEVIKAATDVATTAANKGIGKLTDLLLSKKLREEKRLDDLSAAQTKKDIELIENGLAEYRDGKFLLMEDQIGNPTSALGLILTQNKQDQSENLGKCLGKAYEYLAEKDDKEINDEQISGTFFNKWVNYGKEVSEEELQDLWGRILAEETADPNSVNYLVLNTLSMMSKYHLENLIKLMSYTAGRIIYVDNCKADKSYWFEDISQFDLEELVDLKILEGIELEGRYTNTLNTFELSNANEVKKFAIIRKSPNHKYILLIEADNIIKLDCIRLTTIGKKLVEIYESNSNQLEETEKFAKKLQIFNGLNNIQNIFLGLEEDNKFAILKKI